MWSGFDFLHYSASSSAPLAYSRAHRSLYPTDSLQAASSDVLVALPGTVQGSSGFYMCRSGEVTAWEVGPTNPPTWSALPLEPLTLVKLRQHINDPPSGGNGDGGDEQVNMKAEAELQVVSKRWGGVELENQIEKEQRSVAGEGGRTGVGSLTVTVVDVENAAAIAVGETTPGSDEAAEGVARAKEGAQVTAQNEVEAAASRAKAELRIRVDEEAEAATRLDEDARASAMEDAAKAAASVKEEARARAEETAAEAGARVKEEARARAKEAAAGAAVRFEEEARARAEEVSAEADARADARAEEEARASAEEEEAAAKAATWAEEDARAGAAEETGDVARGKRVSMAAAASVALAATSLGSAAARRRGVIAMPGTEQGGPGWYRGPRLNQVTYYVPSRGGGGGGTDAAVMEEFTQPLSEKEWRRLLAQVISIGLPSFWPTLCPPALLAP